MILRMQITLFWILCAVMVAVGLLFPADRFIVLSLGWGVAALAAWVGFCTGSVIHFQKVRPGRWKMTITTLAALLVLPCAALASGDYGAINDATIKRWIDGDTLVIDLSCQYPVICKNILVRVSGIDTPEMDGECQQERDMAREALAVATELTKDAKVTLPKTGRDKYFRINSPVLADGVDVGAELIHMSLAVPYDGKKARTKDWCKDDR